MKSFIKCLNCGYVIKNRTCLGWIVIKFADITEKIIPFFKKYPIHGVKAKDFAYWSLVAEMIKQKKHFTAEGLEEIRKIKAGMNWGIKYD